MEDVDLRHAKEHLEELIERARRGEDVPPFVPLKEKRKLGHLKGKIPPPPDDFFDPLSEEELTDWYGDD